MYRVFIQNLEFYAHHGVPAEERVIGHRYVVSLDMQVDGNATQTDNVHDTVDYGEVASVLFDVATGRQFKTIERVAQGVGDALLARYPRIQSVEVRLSKRLPPAPMIAEMAGVVINVSR